MGPAHLLFQRLGVLAQALWVVLLSRYRNDKGGETSFMTTYETYPAKQIRLRSPLPRVAGFPRFLGSNVPYCEEEPSKDRETTENPDASCNAV